MHGRQAPPHQASATDAEVREPGARGSISVAIISYDETLQELCAAVEVLLAQTRAPDEILIVDNGTRLGSGPFADALTRYEPTATVIVPEQNLGYVGGVNLAAARAWTDYLVCVNPDAQVEAQCLEHLAQAADCDPKVALVGAQILLADGVTRNAGDNPVHPTGISTAGGYGEPREHGDCREVAAVSGACCLIRREAFLTLGGFVHELFMYYDDVDLAWRARIAGWRVVYCPAALVRHEYEFARRGRKWFYLERNRLFSVLANYEARTLALLAPLLLATELGLLLVAGAQGWLADKLQSYRSLLSLRRTLTVERRKVQRSRRRTDGELMALFDDRIDSALVPAAGAALANAVCVPYMRLVRARLRGPGSPVGPQGSS